MRANFARHGRRLLASRARAPSCAIYSAPARRRLLAPAPTVCRTFERTIFNIFFQKAPREVRQPEYEPGWMHIMIWRSRMLEKVRPPPRKELIEAWKRLMQSKLRTRTPMNSTQALQCRRLLEYLTKPAKPDQNVKPLSSADLAMARQVLLDIAPDERSQHHLDFARALHEVWMSGNFSGKVRSTEQQWAYLVKMLSIYGDSSAALEMLYSKWNTPEYAAFLTQDEHLVGAVAAGLAREGKEKELLGLAEYAEAHGVAYDSVIQAAIVPYFSEQNRVQETQFWFTKPIKTNTQVAVYRSVASFAMRNDLQDWATPFFLKLGESSPKRKYWDVLLQAVLLMGKSLAEVSTMMSHMVDRNGDVEPTIHTINGLVDVAIELNDPQLAKSVLALGLEKGLSPNGETYIAVLDLCVASDNLADAREAFAQVQHLDPLNNESKPELSTRYTRLVNRYLVALARQTPPDFKYIISVLETVEEYGLRLEPETVASLCLRFLENDQHFDVMDILAIHSFMYSEGQREVVQNAFIQFCLDPKTSTSRAWGGYQLLQQFFEDTSFERRTRLMEAFFERKRPDMASHVFGHMRQHRNQMYHPRMETYIKCLQGFAQNPDLEGVEMVHNMLKMDTTVQTDTKLHTALMLAYTGCDKPLIALDFWSQITQSQEGPSYATLQAVFWALERKPGGYKMAREVWDRIERMDLEVPAGVYNAYVGAIAGSGSEKEVRSVIMKMPSVVGTEPEPMT